MRKFASDSLDKAMRLDINQILAFQQKQATNFADLKIKMN